MKYQSTRDISENIKYVESAEAIKTGLAPDGGLYMPSEIPQISPEYIKKLCALGYNERATEILSLFLTDYDKDDIAEDCRTAYAEE
ncbi:MAG: threonine synthase, partial [Clostridia bacterium]|nr:threonine synthase [Clostridia bacterium]